MVGCRSKFVTWSIYGEIVDGCENLRNVGGDFLESFFFPPVGRVGFFFLLRRCENVEVKITGRLPSLSRWRRTYRRA